MKFFVVLLSVCPLLLNPISAHADGPRFWAPYKHVIDQDPRSVCIADFNADGIQDFAVANSYDGVAIVLSNGDGSFKPAIKLAGGYSTLSICSGDFDGDGDPDLAALYIAYDEYPYDDPDYIRTFLNTGNGTFSEVPVIVLGLNDHPTRACAPDLDHDGDAELVVVLKSLNRVRVFVSNGNGSFTPGSNPVVGTVPVSIWPADFNGDGHTDVVVANSVSNNVSVLLGGGDGTLGAAANFAVLANPLSVCAEDFNEDGDPDVAVVNNGSNNISVLLGNGNGTLGPLNTYYAVTSPQAICPVDLDDDGHPDLAVASMTTRSVCTLMGNGNGTFDPAECLVGGDSPESIASGDMDDDGTLDLATANQGSRSVSVYFNTGNGASPKPAKYLAGDGPWDIVTADLNGDGDLDVAVTNRYDNNLSVYLNVGYGVYSPRTSYGAGGEPLSICSGDFDFDGDQDLAVGNNTISTPGTVSVLLNQGDGTFGPRVPYVVLVSPSSVCAADVNGDNVDDIAVANMRSDKVSVLVSNGNGTFQTPVHYAAGVWPGSMITGDFDGDDDTDLVVANNHPSGPGGISILKNTGNGTFLAPVGYGYASPTDICGGDFDGDGDIDIAAQSIVSTLYIFSNYGPGTFSDPVTYSGLYNHTSMVSADLDGDSDVDLAIANLQFDDVLMMVNGGTGVFGKVRYGVHTQAPNSGPRGIAPGDVDGDGDVDLVTANFDSDDITVLINRQISLVTPVIPPKVATREQLYQNVPNPFNPTTTIRYDIRERGLVTLTIYNVMGQRVRTLVNEAQAPRAGGFAVSWNGRNDAGQSVASGVYFYKLTAGSYSQVKKMVLLK